MSDSIHSDTDEHDLGANEAPQKADKRSYKYKCLKAGCGATVDDKKGGIIVIQNMCSNEQGMKRYGNRL